MVDKFDWFIEKGKYSKTESFLSFTNKSCIASLIKNPVERPDLENFFNSSYSSTSTATQILCKFLFIMNGDIHK